jgi:D-alanyl-D-alanine carboxypeptidase
MVLAVGLIGLTGCTSSNSPAGSTTSSGAAASGAAASGAAGSGSVGASTGAEPAYVAKVSASVEQTMKDNVIPGAVVLISSKDQGEWTGAFGTRTWGMDDPIQATDQFRIGSNTKTMTSTVILQLVQEGKLALDDPISKYIDGVPGGDQITIANLSEMRSGLYSYSFDTGFNNTLDQQPQKVWTPQELIDIAFSHPQNGPPGQSFDYSNTNIVLLGMVIEKLTGMTASEAFQERIFTPLGLMDSSLPLNSDIPNPHPQGYSFGSNTSTISTFALPAAEQPLALDGRLLPNNETMANPSWAWTAGGAISTVQNMKTYVEAMVDGGLLDAATQKIRMDSIEPINPAQPESGYGLGIVKFDKLYGHDGQIPGYMTFMGHDPESGLTIVIATNLATIPNGEGSALAILKGILPIFYPNMVIPGDPAAAPGATGGGAPQPGATTSAGG